MFSFKPKSEQKTLPSKKNSQLTKDELEARKKSIQEWFPLKDINRYFAVTKGKMLISMIKVEAINLPLQSTREQKKTIHALFETLNGVNDPYQYFCFGKPVNLDNHIEDLNNILGEVTLSGNQFEIKRKRLLQNYIRETSLAASSGEIMEKQFYIILTAKMEKYAETELETKMRTLSSNLMLADLKSIVCTETEIRDVYFNYFQPSNASMEESDFSELMPILQD